MKEVMSSEFTGDPIRFGCQTGTLNLYDGLTTPFSNDVIVLSEQHRKQIEEFVKLAADQYAKEPTLVQDKFSLPSLVTRVDCTIDSEGSIIPYEMEDSPSGQGITDALHTAAGNPGLRERVRGHFEDLLGEVPTVIVSNARNHGTDDVLIFGGSNYVGIGHYKLQIKEDSPVIVKAIPGNELSRQPYIKFQPQAVAPLVTEGDKTYAKRLGLFKEVNASSDLLKDNGLLRSQVVKAKLGSMSLGISIFLSPEDRKIFGKAGTVTASRLERNLDIYLKQSGAYVQEFTPPVQIQNNELYTNAMLRVFVLLNRLGGKVVARAIGGCYVARNELLLHGASNATTGAVLVQ